MEILQSSLYAVALSFCLFFIALRQHCFKTLSSSFFVAFLVLKILTYAIEWALLHPEISSKALLTALLMALSFLPAPCLWLYARESSEAQKPALKEIPSKERLLLTLALLLSLPVALTALPAVNDAIYVPMGERNTSIFVHGTMLLCILLFWVQVPYYLKKCLTILDTQTRNFMALFANLDDMPLNILRALIWLVSAHWLATMGRMATVWFTDGASPLYLVFTACEVFTGLWAMLAIIRSVIEDKDKPMETYTPESERSAYSLQAKTPNPDPLQAQFAKEKYTTYVQDEILIDRISNKVILAMEKDELFKDSALNLQKLCSHIHENSHYVSQAINMKLNTTFYELVNNHRINLAKQLLSRKKSSILDVAYEVGYNSKSTFNSAFKRLTQLTPSQYRKQIATRADGSSTL